MERDRGALFSCSSSISTRTRRLTSGSTSKVCTSLPPMPLLSLPRQMGATPAGGGLKVNVHWKPRWYSTLRVWARLTATRPSRLPLVEVRRSWFTARATSAALASTGMGRVRRPAVRRLGGTQLPLLPVGGAPHKAQPLLLLLMCRVKVPPMRQPAVMTKLRVCTVGEEMPTNMTGAKGPRILFRTKLLGSSTRWEGSRASP